MTRKDKRTKKSNKSKLSQSSQEIPTTDNVLVAVPTFISQAELRKELEAEALDSVASQPVVIYRPRMKIL
jgi:hypothetical protein